MFDLIAYEAEVHELCGLHDSIAKKNPDLRVEPVSCPLCADVERMKRVQAEHDEAADARLGKNPPASARRATDGRRGWIRRLITTEELAAERAQLAADRAKAKDGRSVRRLTRPALGKRRRTGRRPTTR